MKKFECQGCGKCCLNFGKLGTLPLFDFEKERFEELGKKLNIKLKFVPENILIETSSKRLVCLNWGILGNPCPFLDKNKKCLIYKDRALICRAFPIEKIPEKIQNLKPNCFIYCPNNQDFQNISNLLEFEKVYGNESINARKNIEKIKTEIELKIKEHSLIEKKFIRAKNPDFSKVISFSEFDKN